MRIIPATLGYEAIVDDDDYERLSRLRWYAHSSTKSNGRIERRPARRTGASEGRKVIYLVHHIIKPEPGFVVDHINGNPWDNRKENLRVCTNAENLLNRKKHGGSCTNPFKGVYQRGGQFLAKIRARGETHELGWYADAKAAAVAYDRAALYLHGEYARLNFPDAGTPKASPEAIRAEASAAARPTRRHPRRDEALAQIRLGAKACHVAASIGVSTPSVTKWALEAGIPLRRGRPRKTTPDQQAAA